MTIKFVEFFVYIKILHVIVKINTVTIEVVPLEFNTLGPASLPLLEAILEFFNCQCLQGVGSRLFNFTIVPQCLSFISFLTLGNAKKSFGAKSGNQGQCRITMVRFLASHSLTSVQLWEGALSLCKTQLSFSNISGRTRAIRARKHFKIAK